MIRFDAIVFDFDSNSCIVKLSANLLYQNLVI